MSADAWCFTVCFKTIYVTRKNDRLYQWRSSPIMVSKYTVIQFSACRRRHDVLLLLLIRWRKIISQCLLLGHWPTRDVTYILPLRGAKDPVFAVHLVLWECGRIMYGVICLCDCAGTAPLAIAKPSGVMIAEAWLGLITQPPRGLRLCVTPAKYRRIMTSFHQA